jgi:hypothetical protein
LYLSPVVGYGFLKNFSLLLLIMINANSIKKFN